LPPWPIATITITAKTPTMIPSAVSRLRSLCRRRFLIPKRKVSNRKFNIRANSNCNLQFAIRKWLHGRNHFLENHRQENSRQDCIRGRAVSGDQRHRAAGADSRAGDPQAPERHAERSDLQRRATGGANVYRGAKSDGAIRKKRLSNRL